MSWWTDITTKLGKSLGLLGKPYKIENTDRKFGSAPEYWAVQVEWPDAYKIEGVGDTVEGEETVILLTEDEFKRALRRAESNQEDLVLFLDDHSIQDAID